MLEEGYYTGGTIDTSLEPTGTVTYDHHVHDVGTADMIISNEDSSKSSVSGSYDDDYKSSFSGGCFTTVGYNRHTHTGKANQSYSNGCYTKRVSGTTAGHTPWYEQGGGSSRADNQESRTCPYCGRSVGNGWGNGGDDSIVWYWQCDGKTSYTYYDLGCGYKQNEIISTYYTRSCNRLQGEVVEAHIKY